jgi:Zn-dependent protease
MNTFSSDDSLPATDQPVRDVTISSHDAPVEAILVENDDDPPSGSIPSQVRPRRLRRPIVLFVITCITTYCAGCYHWAPTILGMGDVWTIVTTNWRDGLLFMGCVMGILLFHEMGHFLMTLRHRIPASFPFFIPFPMMITGTMGAVIAMDGKRADRKQLFDIGIAGPLAGLILIVPLVIYGLKTAEPVPMIPKGREFGDPLIVKMLIPLFHDMDQIKQDFIKKTGEPRWENFEFTFRVNAVYMAGWVGMLVTGLNMMPVSQLDGGHVIHALFGRRSKWIARGFLFMVIAFMIWYQSTDWILMLILVLIIGPVHPPTADDTVDIGIGRRVLGVCSLAIPILCFPPVPFTFYGPG